MTIFAQTLFALMLSYLSALTFFTTRHSLGAQVLLFLLPRMEIYLLNPEYATILEQY